MDSPTMQKYLDGEISILKELSNPYIVKFYDKLNDDNNYYIFMEYCNGGTLSENLVKYLNVYNEPFSIEIIQYFMRQIISAFCHIHSKGIIHRDIKLTNILLSFDDENDIKNLNLMKGIIKIIDFGVATKLGEDKYAYTVIGSPSNMDPLILKKYLKAGGYEKLQGYNEKADVWSLGVIFYQLLSGQNMFSFNSREEFLKNIEEGNYYVPINKNFSKEAISFLNCMLQYEADDRISVQNLAQHDFIVNNVSSFTMPNFEKISYKIGKRGLQINFKLNESISKEFNSAKAINQMKNKSDNFVSKNPLNRANTYDEGGFVFSGDIFANEKNKTDRKNSVGDIDTNKPVEDPQIALKRFSDGNTPIINPIQVQQLTKIEEELMETIKLDKDNTGKKQSLKESKRIESQEIKEKNKGEREQAKLYINGLLDEYKAVKEYFNKNGLTKQEQDATEKCNKIQTLLESFEKDSNIDFESLPKPITPEYLYNCPTEKRNAIFQDIINQYNEKKTDLEANIRQSILTYKKVDKATFQLIKKDIMAKLESEKSRVEKYRQIIELFQQRCDDIWTPPPEITKNVEFGKFEKITFEGCIYKMIIHTSKNNYYTNYNNRFTIKLNMKINEEKNYYGDVNILSYGDFEKEITWNLKENEWKNLSNYFINVDFYMDNDFKLNQKINISKIKDEKQLRVSYPISFLNQPEAAIINFDIKIIMPEGKKITVGKREYINITKNFAPFEGKSPYTNEIPKLFLKK
jgi:serine/threonine protein kinase